jgi:eukaryotic-like serine/threonine-protein kinase
MSLAAGSRIGPYEVKFLLGEGGIGQVWRAHDTRLRRDVALKMLPAETLGDETTRASLVREARLASKLSHPHICTIYEVGEANGQTFVATELVEGQPLSALLAEGALPIDQVLRYGQQVAEALAHAHGRGVVHRDLNSANVVVTPDGQVKVLDFGSAKGLTIEELAEATTGWQHSLTDPGTVAETLAYMAPEQLRGEPAEARSDIWALGVVLYEMVSGKPPFRGETGFELTSAILSQPLPPLPSSLPAPLAGVIDRCLTKEPGERYQQATEALAALEAVASGRAETTWRVVLRRRRGLLVGSTLGALALLVVAAVLVGLDVGGLRSRMTGGAAVSAHIIRLAVLPFANLSGSADQEYFSDGLTQELITQLGRLHPGGLEVIGRTSVMRYKKGDTPIEQIGRDLKLDYILQGSARLDGTAPEEGGRVRIAAQLIKVADQARVWGDEYERELAGILVLQSDVARNVARALALALLPAEQARLASVRTVIPGAYDAYSRGTYHWQKLSRADLDTAQQYFDLALKKDPDYAPAYAGLANVWACRQQIHVTTPRETGPKSKAAALQAIALDDSSAEAHAALADVLTWTDWDWAGAEKEWRRALALDPNAANTRAYFSNFLAITGRSNEAMPHIKLALELDPYNALYHNLYAAVLQYQNRYDEAIAEGRAALAIQPGLQLARATLQLSYQANGMRDEQLALQRESIARDPERVAALERGLAEAGYEGAQRRIAEVLTARYGRAGGPGAFVVAKGYFDAGDIGRAVDWLEKAYEERDPNLPYLGRPLFNPLRADPRFQDLLRRIGLPQ